MIFRWYKFVDWVHEGAKNSELRKKEKRARRMRWHFHFAWKPRIIGLPVGPLEDPWQDGVKTPRTLMHVAWLETIARRATYSNSYKPNKKMYEYGPITNVVTQKG